MLVSGVPNTAGEDTTNVQAFPFLLTSCLTLSHCPEGFPGGSVVKNLPASAADTGVTGLVSGSERSAGGENGNPLQYSWLGNPMDRGV